MNVAIDSTITGYTTIPVSERVGAPKGRAGRSYVGSILRRQRTKSRIRQDRQAVLAAERASAPPFGGSRDSFAIRHADNLLRQF